MKRDGKWSGGGHPAASEWRAGRSRSPSTGYKLRKFIKRNRGQVIAGGVVAAALVLGIVGPSVGMVWAVK